jgi:DNA repair protein RecO (recombination protein O)
MLHTTRGIVFQQVKYAESSVIAKIYTELFGLQSYMIRGVGSKKSKIRQGLLQHLSRLEMVVYHKEKKEIQEVKEIKIYKPFSSIPGDVRKGAVLLFFNEILNKTVREQEANKPLFEFISAAIEQIDMQQKGLARLNLELLIRLTQFLGFAPVNNFSTVNSVFDLREGKFTQVSLHPEYFAGLPFSRYLNELINTGSCEEQTNLSGRERSELLEILLRYYTLHIPEMKEIKSHLVLHSVFNH